MALPRTLGGRRSRKAALLALVALAQAGAVALTALLVERMFSGIAGPAGMPSRYTLLLLSGLCLLPAAVGGLRWYERHLAEALGQGYVHAVRLALFDKLGRLGRGDTATGASGVHMQRFVGDLSAMRNWASLGLARLLTGAILAAGALLVLVVIDPTLAGAAGSVLLVGTFGSVLLGRRLRHTLKDARRQRARLASDIAERIVAMPVVQAFGQIRRERRRIARRSRRLRTAMVDKAGAVGLLRGTTDLTTGLSLAAILAVAAFSGDSLEPSAIVAALSVIGILNPALGDLSRVWEFWHGYRVAADRLTDFLDATVSVKAHPGAPPLLVGAGAIAIEEVTFGDVLRNVDLRIAPGEKVAIVGTNGAGKSTLLSLMARLAAPDSGRVRIDGTDLARCNLASVRAAIGIVSPDLPLLRGTVARNIRYRKPQANVNELAAAVHLCGLDALIAELPGGLDHHIAEGGGNLSAGQRQRIGLARAVVAAPRILLLDEPDANLDAASRAVIGRILAAFEGTVVFVSHDIATVRLADRVVCLADGAIVEQGAPDELLAGVGQVSRILKPQLTRVA